MRLRVPELLTARHMTAYALSKALEGRVSRSAVYRMAAGEKVSLALEEIAGLCDVLGVEPGELFERSRSEPRKKPRRKSEGGKR